MTQNNETIRILIADDHKLFCEGIKTLLSSQPEFQVVGEARDGEEACQLVEKLHPDILLLDLLMPKTDGMHVLQSLAESRHQIRTILLSGAVDGEQITKAFELGLRGLVLKDSSASLLFQCIRTVMAGQYWIGWQSVANLAEMLQHHKKSAKKLSPKNYGITPREMQILKAAVSGYLNKEIAGQYHISEQTVKHHLTSIFDKLGVCNRIELTRFAFHHNLIEE
jgi:two-component system, NarL family, nitrate/nitrite response regulator NarL